METLGNYLSSARKSLFRFEYLQDFSGTDTESFGEWQRTGKIDQAALQPWWDFLEKKHTEGITTARVRLVALPLSDYTKFELEIHRETAKHGDDIRIITDNTFEKLAIPYTDFWMIDDMTVIQVLYGERGVFKGIELEKGDEEGYRLAKEKLISASTPIRNFSIPEQVL